jgi:hypothetical protein
MSLDTWKVRIAELESLSVMTHTHPAVDDVVCRLRDAEAAIRQRADVGASKLVPPVHAAPRLCSHPAVASAVLSCCSALLATPDGGDDDDGALLRRGREWAARAISKSLRPCFTSSGGLDLLAAELHVPRDALIAKAAEIAYDGEPPAQKRQRRLGVDVAAELDRLACVAMDDARVVPRAVGQAVALCRVLAESREAWTRFLATMRAVCVSTGSPVCRDLSSAICCHVLSSSHVSGDPLAWLPFGGDRAVVRVLASMQSLDPLDVCDPERRHHR